MWVFSNPKHDFCQSCTCLELKWFAASSHQNRNPPIRLIVFVQHNLIIMHLGWWWLDVINEQKKREWLQQTEPKSAIWLELWYDTILGSIEIGFFLRTVHHFHPLAYTLFGYMSLLDDIARWWQVVASRLMVKLCARTWVWWGWCSSFDKHESRPGARDGRTRPIKIDLCALDQWSRSTREREWNRPACFRSTQ